ncbi:MAG TPA: flagellar hook-basal body complex protein [Brevundimonas sp.]|nr:flagellar hook-basal body complex protein [Brevundimonas sp.]
MLGAIYIGLSGMNAFSRGLQTISHNVANMSTPGFKASSVNFSDVFSTGGLGSAYSGHQNGAGVRFGSPSVDFRQGDMRQTGGDLDLAIEGDGFLVLSKGDRTYYARTGQFGVNEEGYIALLGSSYNLNVLSPSGATTAVNIDDRRTYQPVATTKIAINGILSTNSTEGIVENIPVYAADGTEHVWKLSFKPSTEVPVEAGKYTLTITNGKGVQVGDPKTVKFTNGVLTSGDSLTISYPTTGDQSADVTLDLSALQNINIGPASEIRRASSDGNGLGVLTKVSVTEKGQLQLIYSNTKTVDLGQVALAVFEDQQQLQRLGDGLFRNNGSEARLGTTGAKGIGDLVSGQIEASNVDLAQQFGELILIQRGFQASSQVVSVSNDMIQQLFGIRGQG